MVDNVEPQRIVVPIDPTSTTANRAIPVAVAAAKLFGCAIELLQCVEDPHQVSAAQRDLEPLRSTIRLEHPDVVVRSSTIVNPNAPEEIVRAVQPGHLPVIATRAQALTLRHYIGSAAEKVVAQSGRPVLLVGPAADADDAMQVSGVIAGVAPQTGLLDTDTLDLILLAQHWARQLAVPLQLVTVVSDDDQVIAAQQWLNDVVARFLLPGQEADVRVLRSSQPADAICRIGAEALIVMSSHARAGLARFTLGSVTTNVVRHATRAVLVAHRETSQHQPTAPTGLEHAPSSQ